MKERKIRKPFVQVWEIFFCLADMMYYDRGEFYLLPTFSFRMQRYDTISVEIKFWLYRAGITFTFRYVILTYLVTLIFSTTAFLFYFYLFFKFPLWILGKLL